MKQFLISGYLGFENFGDEALLHVLIQNLLDTGVKKENITVISNTPAKTKIMHGINSVHRWNMFEVLSALINNDALIFIGGLFQDKTSFRSFLYYFVQLFMGKILQKEIVFFGVGLEPFYRKLTHFLFDFGMKRLHLITVRDQTSAHQIPNAGQVTVTCDPVWSIKPDFSFKNQIPYINWESPVLGVSLKNDKNLKRQYLLNIADKLARVLVGMKDWQMLLIPCMPQEDLPVLNELYDLIQKRVTSSSSIFLLENFTHFPLLQQAGIIASCDVMVGMRYHALLVPMINEKPVFGLIYDQKIKSLIEFSGQIGSVYKDNFDQPWSYFWQNLEYSAKQAKEAHLRALELHKKNVELLKQLI